MRTIEIQTGKPYEVKVKEGLVKETAQTVRAVCPNAVRAAVVTDDHVAQFWLESVTETLEQADYQVCSFVTKNGEESKSLGNLGRLLSFLAQNRLTRSDVVIALGGGVVGDLAGFAAASYNRGIGLIQMPTSLLAMVDSSVGGKTAVNLPEGKNLAGVFYQPDAVLIDPAVLETLPEEIFRDGCAEIVKYGVLSGGELFETISAQGTGFDREETIARCVEIKNQYVSADERESGVRKMLNLGHTFAHAIEADSGFEISHGKAVAVGLCLMVHAAVCEGLCTEECAQRIVGCVAKMGLPTSTERSVSDLMPFVLSDKKRHGDSITLIVPEEIGRCLEREVPQAEAEHWLEEGLESQRN